MKSIRCFALLLLITALLFFAGLGNHPLQGSTEPRVGGIAMEMYLHRDWVTPRLNGEPFLEKPPLSLWLDSAAMTVFGPSAWAVRLASALAGLFSVLLLFITLRRLDRPMAVATAAALMLATSASFWSNVRQVGEDSLLSLGVSLALLGFYLASRQRSAASALMFITGIAVATLSKGVLGLALPGVVIFAWLLAETLRDRRLAPGRWLWPAGLTLVGLVPLSVWLALLYQQGGAQALNDVLWANSVGRFNGSFSEAGHFEPFHYYLGKLPEAFLPWNLLVYLGLWHFRKQWRVQPHLMFFSLWLLAQFALLTLASSKRMVYLMALAPPAAVIAAEYANVLLARWQGWRAAATGLMAVVVLAYLAAVWVIPQADQAESFLPLTERIRALQAQGHTVALATPSERLAGAGVFYSRSLLPALPTEEALTHFLAQQEGNVAVMERQDEPGNGLVVMEKLAVGTRVYYFLQGRVGTDRSRQH
ncbi:ArnT family glycosyltransferase [Pseudomonas eucalypticola]|uniref:Glycosyltransferase family 39 protein n=1 Tax=Pseudomonas eucalypticola TaxID=2599595 RepID=A0A7D5HHT1_9PSED|nr:glycosyltransferase family 39 protein [Pseudomonas eucalypticola]QKZ05606.1 glycosyltransferase family 39 protein [Pseudomonas eucalypticola]